MKSSENEIEGKLLELRKELESKEASETEIGDAEDDLTFLFLEQELQRLQLTRLEQLPLRGTSEVILLANSLPSNARLFEVIQKLKLTDCAHLQPSQYLVDRSKFISRRQVLCPYLTGTSFQSNWDQSTHSDPVLTLGDLKYPSLVGFALPEHLTCTRIGKMYDLFKVFRSNESFIGTRLAELGLPIQIQSSSGRLHKWQGEPKAGYNISHRKQYGDIAFTFVREFRQFSLRLQKSTPLKANFLNRVRETTDYSPEEFFGLKQWEDFFGTFGTHVVEEANGGGRLVVTVLETQLKNFLGTEDLWRKEKEIADLLANLVDTEAGDGGTGRPSRDPPVETLLISSIRLFGGSPEFQTKDLTRCADHAEMKGVIQEWLKTLPFSPVMLDSELKLVSLSNLLEEHGMLDEARLLDTAARKLFGKSFHTPKPENIKPSRWRMW